MDVTSIAGDLLSAASALAGLLLVFLSAVVVQIEAYPAQAKALKKKLRSRAWTVLIGFFCSLAAAALALAGTWPHREAMVWSAVVLLSLALFLTAIAAIQMVWGME